MKSKFGRDRGNHFQVNMNRHELTKCRVCFFCGIYIMNIYMYKYIYIDVYIGGGGFDGGSVRRATFNWSALVETKSRVDLLYFFRFV